MKEELRNKNTDRVFSRTFLGKSHYGCAASYPAAVTNLKAPCGFVFVKQMSKTEPYDWLVQTGTILCYIVRLTSIKDLKQ